MNEKREKIHTRTDTDTPRKEIDFKSIALEFEKK